jgi:hypothetical protein
VIGTLIATLLLNVSRLIDPGMHMSSASFLTAVLPRLEAF